LKVINGERIFMKNKAQGTRTVLVVDDELNVRTVLMGLLGKKGYSVLAAASMEEALPALHGDDLVCVITDLKMPGKSGMDLLEAAREERPGLPVIMITAHGDIETAVAAMKGGAYDFITKPFDEEELLSVTGKAVSEHLGNMSLVSSFFEDSDEPFPGFVGRSPAFEKVVQTVRKVGPTDSTVLILGETGVGKELVARALHHLSHRNKKPFVKVNCSAIPETLVESELFGHEKGAFTGAVTSKPGRFELADGGTIFLDEVGEVPASLQVKLLNVLQDSAFERVGGVETIQVDIRIVAATNRDLVSAVSEGQFRADLYYRLNVVPIRVPPLRERKEDLEPTIHYFLERYGAKYRKETLSLTPEIMTAFATYAWPGNVRELENVLERMIVLADSHVLGADLLPEEFGDVGAAATTGDSFKDTVGDISAAAERQMILEALSKAGDNRTRAAELLGISRRTLQNKIKKYEIG
jgi:DNA-binding NtrC family response regulator